MTNIKCLISSILIMGGVAAALADESAQTTIQVESCGCIKVKTGTLRVNCYSGNSGYIYGDYRPRDCTEIHYSSVADLKRKWREGRYWSESNGGYHHTDWDNFLVWDLEEENGTLWLVPYVIKTNIVNWDDSDSGGNNGN